MQAAVAYWLPQSKQADLAMQLGQGQHAAFGCTCHAVRQQIHQPGLALWLLCLKGLLHQILCKRPAQMLAI